MESVWYEGALEVTAVGVQIIESNAASRISIVVPRADFYVVLSWYDRMCGWR